MSGSGFIDGSQIEHAIENTSAEGLTAVRADLRPDLFDRAIAQKGYRIRWEQGMFCSCISRDSGQPDYTCDTCKGKGYIYFNPREMRAVVTSINGRKDQHRIGLDDIGTAYLTPKSTDNVGFRDKFTFLDFTTKFSEVLTRDEFQTGTRTDTLRYPAQDVIVVRHLDTIYMRGKDFNMSKDGKTIEWVEDFMYPGTRYSILYITNPVYIAIGPIHELRGTYTTAGGRGLEIFRQLPKQYQIKREDFLVDG